MPAPTQPTQPPGSAVGAKLAAGGAVGYAGAGVLGLAPAAASAAAAAAGTALSASAIGRITDSILSATAAHFRERRPQTEAKVREVFGAAYPTEPPERIDQLAREEVLREREFQRRMAERMRRDLPKALAEGDPDRRRDAVRSVLERERRYIEMREEAITSRAVARTEREAVKSASPRGAFWYLSPNVQRHTPDCLALGNKFWPWEFLDEVHPLLHVGCQCQLLTLEDAVRRGYMGEGQADEDPKVKAAIGHKLLADALAVAEATDEQEWALWLAELQEADRGLELEEGASTGGAMVALYPKPEVQRRLAAHPEADEPASHIHLTLVFLTPDASTLDARARARIRQAVKRAAAKAAPLRGEVGGLGMFKGDGEERPLIALADVPGLNEFRADLVAELGRDAPKEGHGFTPHITLRYVPKGEGPKASAPPRSKLDFGDVHLVIGGKKESFPLGVDVDEAVYDRRWPSGTKEGGRFRPRVGGTAHELSRLKRAVLRDLIPALPLTPELARARRAGERRTLNGRSVFVPEWRSFDRTIGGRRFVSPVGTTRTVERPAESPGTQGIPGRASPAILGKLRSHRVGPREEAERRARDAAAIADPSVPPVTEGQAAADADEALRAAGFLTVGLSDREGSYRSPSGGSLGVSIDRGRVSAVRWSPTPAPAPAAELARPARTLGEFEADLLAYAHRYAGEHGHSAQAERVVMSPDYEDHAGEAFPDGTIYLGEDVGRDILAGAAARERGRRPDDDALRTLWRSNVAAHHEALHAADPMALELFRDRANVALDEALTEEVARLEAVGVMRRQGQQDVVDWAADHPWEPMALGTYLPERGELGAILDAGGVPAQRREALVRRLLSAAPERRFAILSEATGTDEGALRRSMRSPSAGDAPVLALPADPTFRPSGLEVGGEDIQAGDGVTGRDGRSGVVLALSSRGGVPVAAVAWEDGSVDSALGRSDIASARHSPQRVAGSIHPSAGPAVEGGALTWDGGGAARVVRVLRGGDDWLAEGRTDDGAAVLLTPASAPNARGAEAAGGPPTRPPTPAAPLEARAELAAHFDMAPGTELARLSELVPTARPRGRPRWPGTRSGPLEVSRRADGRWDVVGGNDLYFAAAEDGLAWLPVRRDTPAGAPPPGEAAYPGAAPVDGDTAAALEDLGLARESRPVTPSPMTPEANRDMSRAEALRMSAYYRRRGQGALADRWRRAGGRHGQPLPDSWREPLTTEELVALVKGGATVTQDEWRAGLEGGMEAMLRAGFVLSQGAARALPKLGGRGEGAITPLDEIAARHPQVRLWADETPTGIKLSMVRTPPELRGRGLASAALRDVLDYADRTGQTVALTPGSPEGTQGPGALSKRKLTEWYRRHGFVPNRGRNKDFGFAESMVRPPRGGRRERPILEEPPRSIPDFDYPWGPLPRTDTEVAIPAAVRAAIPSLERITIRAGDPETERETGYPWNHATFHYRDGTVRGDQFEQQHDLAELYRTAWYYRPRGRGEQPVPDLPYQTGHRPPDAEPHASMDDTSAIYPPDLYGPEGARLYGHGGDSAAMDRATLRTIRAARGRPDAPVTVYRAVRSGDPDRINPGDWVTPNRDYAVLHGESNLGHHDETADGWHPDYKVLEREVRAGDLYTEGNSIHEWGWSPGGRQSPPLGDRPWPWQKKQDAERAAVDEMHAWADAVQGDAPTDEEFERKARRGAPKAVRDDSGAVRVLGSAGGSNGARWAEADDGTRFVVKTYRGDADRVATEALANAVYRKLGIAVPEGGLLSFKGKPAFSSRLVEGGKERRWREPSPELARGFMADALLANWDVVGLDQDNVLWREDGPPVRVDQGGTLEYRAMGGRKEYGPVPTEVWSMAGPRGQAFGTMALTPDGKRSQARTIERTLTEPVVDSLVDAAPFADEAMRERVRENLKARVAWMGRYARGEESEPAPLEGEAARAAFARAQLHLALYPEQDIALQGFVNGYDAPVQEHLRSGAPKRSASPEVAFIVRELDSLLDHARAPADATVYFALPDASAAASLAGKEVRERGYLAAAVDEAEAAAEAGPHGAVVALRVPEGAGALLVHSSGAENLPPQPEVLLERGLRFRVAGVRHEGGAVVLDAAAL